MTKKIEVTIIINAQPSIVWENLTNPNLMKQWMGEPEMKIEVLTDWKVGSVITIKGFHHVNFENKGMVLQFEPLKIAQYSQLSSVSRLPDVIENYSVITFLLEADKGQTVLTVQVENFPTEVIYHHHKFYWQGTITLLKDFIENNK